MPEMKIRLTDTTSISDITNFFQKLDDTQKVRARKINENEIELYVRGSSKWHLVTDNLKLGFLVTRDYQAAKKKIEDIFNKNGIIKSMRAPQEKLNNVMSNHQHDFHAREIKTDLQNAEKIIAQHEISKNNIKNCKSTHMRFYPETDLSNIVEYLTEGFETAPYSTLEFIKFIQSEIKTGSESDQNSLKSTEIDFEQIENFAIEWQKLTVQKNASSKATDGSSAEKTKSKQEPNFVKKSMAENFINKITAEICRNIPFARVDLSSETVKDDVQN